MKVKCFRCGKELVRPDASNADYVIAEDTVAVEQREVLVALLHNQQTLEKLAQGSIIEDDEYDQADVSSTPEATDLYGENLVRVVAKMKDVVIQKTGVICPDCYKDTDFLIWGVHKPCAG